MGIGVGNGLGLVADDVVAVREDRVHAILEELAKERSRKVHGEDLCL